MNYVSVTREMSRASQRLFGDFDSALTHAGRVTSASPSAPDRPDQRPSRALSKANAARSFSGQSIIARALHADEHEVVTCPGRMSLCCRITVRRQIAHTIATRGGFTRHGLPCQKEATNTL